LKNKKAHKKEIRKILIWGGTGETRKFFDTILHGNNDPANFGDSHANAC
jgi:hypothetical protein